MGIFTFIGKIDSRWFFLLNAFLFSALSVLSWFSYHTAFLWSPIVDITTNPIAFSSFIIFNFAIISLFLTMYNLHPEPLKLKRYDMPMSAVGVFFLLFLALYNVLLFVDFSGTVFFTYLVMYGFTSIMQVFIFLWFIIILKDHGTGYHNVILLLYASFHIFNGITFFILLTLALSPQLILTDPLKAMRYMYASEGLFITQGYIEFACFGLIALLFFIDTMRKPKAVAIQVERVKKDGTKYIEHKRSTIEVSKEGYGEYIEKAHTSEEKKDIIFCKNCGAINTDQDTICFSCRVPLD